MGCANSLHVGDSVEYCATLRKFKKEFEIGELLGRGAYGEVYCATECATGADIAVKIINLGDEGAPSRKDPHNPHWHGRKRKRAWAETEMWRAIGEHPSIVRLLGSFSTDDAWYILMERCECTIPVKFDTNPRLLKEGLPQVFRGMLMGVSACHRHRVVHRDIKMDNFLVGMDGVTVKLCDFGLSRRLPLSAEGLRGTAGTAPMMSPEMVLGELYDTSTDVWSFGATAYLILFGELPYIPKEMSRSSAKEAIRTGSPSPRFLGLPGRRAAFLGQLLERNPRWRCSADEALAHPFLRDPPEKPTVDSRGCDLAEAMQVSNAHLELHSIQGSVELLNSIHGSVQGSIDSLDGNELDSDMESVINIDDHYLGRVDPNEDEVYPNKLDPNNDIVSVERTGTIADGADWPVRLALGAVDA
mmetsp:Transcript_52315/g.139322  ORF Transcript_52315/g.139322 Transcript_52315/m.139322 type:complete len:415 (-) Transcript_52315:192-1436(-)